MNLVICYYNVDKLTGTQKDTELETMRNALEDMVKGENDIHVLVIPVREQKTKIENVYVSNIDDLI